MTLKNFLAFGQKKLEEARLHYSDPYQHMEQLVLRTLDWGFSDLLLQKEKALTGDQLKKVNLVLERRLQGEPLQYILGFEYFYESKFLVGPGCLIPRKETELIVDEVLKRSDSHALRVAELGAGTGNIGISVLLKSPKVNWWAYEINPQSVRYAEQNQKNLLSAEHPYFLRQEDFFVGAFKEAPFDVVVSNPPYVSHAELREIPPEVSLEPRLALDGGESGLEVILKLLSSLSSLLKPNGLFLCEIGSSQEALLTKVLREKGFSQFEILKDFGGLPRLLKVSSSCSLSAEKSD